MGLAQTFPLMDTGLACARSIDLLGHEAMSALGLVSHDNVPSMCLLDHENTSSMASRGQEGVHGSGLSVPK